MIPVIYIHVGEIPTYLLASMKQAALHNKVVILLTDSSAKPDNVTCFAISEYNRGVDVFESVYKHMSTNSKEFEMICIKRWFILRNFINAKGLAAFYYSDSDVMIYDNLNLVYERYSAFDACYALTEFQENYRWTASACCSYWKKEAINKFCDFVLESYSDDKIEKLEMKWRYHQENNIRGGICDMTLLYLFSKEISFFPLSKIVDDACFDQNMLDGENYFKNEYRMVDRPGENRKQKEVSWKKGVPYGYNLLLKKEIKFYVLTEYAKLLEQKRTAFGRIINKIRSVLNK